MTRFPLWHLAVVLLVCLLAFGNSLTGEFVWDDEVQIAENPDLRDLGNIPSAFSRPFWSFVNKDQPNRTNFYRPLQTVAYTAAYAIGGLAPEPYHAISIALHALASVAAYLVCVELGFEASLALLGAVLFAAHPIHTEAVSWIAAMPDVACGWFYFTSLWLFLKSDNGRRRAWWIGSALVLLPALLSKEMAITLPAVLLLLTYRSGAQVLRFEERIRLLAPYGVAALIYGGMRVHALGFLASNQVPATAGMFDWITLGFRAFGEYVLLSFVPYPLIAYRMVPLHLADRLGTTLLGAAFVLALAGLAWKLRKRFLDGLLWYTAFFVMLVPVFYFRGISNALMSDRYLYIPSIMTVLFGLSLLQRSQSKAWVWAAWAVAAVFAGGSVLRNQDWSTRERLYTRTIEQEPHVGVFHLSMANLVLQRGEDPLVLYHLTQAEKNLNDPAYAPVQYDAYNLHIAMTAVLLRSGQVDAAISHLELAAKANPTGEWVAIYRGAIRMAKYEDDAGAVALIEGAIKINPNNEAAYDFLGTAYYNLGRYAEALAAFQRAVALKPDFAVARQHLTLVQQNYPQ